MKTVRISYATKEDQVTDVAKTFDISQDVKNAEPQDKDITAKFPDCYAHFINATTVDMLVPDRFDVSQLGGTIIKSDGLTPIHEFMGHNVTPMVIDKQDTQETPTKTPPPVVVDPKVIDAGK